MKIIYISNAIFPSEVSRSLSIMRVCQAFSDLGHSVILHGISATKDHIDPIKYYGLNGGFTVKTSFISKLIYNKITCWFLIGGLIHSLKTVANIKREKPDIIYSRLTILELFFIPKNLPIVYEMHSLGPLAQKWWHRAAFKFLLKKKNFRRFIVTTNILKDWLEKEIPGSDVVVARLSAERPISIPDTEIEIFRKENLQGEFMHNVGYTGFLDTTGLRGTEIICQSAAKMPDIGFHIVGGEPEKVAHWKNYSKNGYNINNNIYFYGHRNPSEIPFFLKIFDIVVAPLQLKKTKRAKVGEGMSPLKVPQYMAYAKAIVASNIHAHRENLTHNLNALLVEHDNIKAWTNAIAKLHASSEQRENIGKAAYEKYITEYTPEKRIEKILEGL